jgi:hypothetical protein
MARPDNLNGRDPVLSAPQRALQLPLKASPSRRDHKASPGAEIPSSLACQASNGFPDLHPSMPVRSAPNVDYHAARLPRRTVALRDEACQVIDGGRSPYALAGVGRPAPVPA